MKKKQQTAQAVFEQLELNRIKYQTKINQAELKIERAKRIIETLEMKKERYNRRKLSPHWTDVINALAEELAQLTGLKWKTLGTFGLRAEYSLWLYQEPLYTKFKPEGEPEREQLNSGNIIYSLTFTPDHSLNDKLSIRYDTGELNGSDILRDDNGFNCISEALPMPIKAEQVLEIAKQVKANTDRRYKIKR